MADQHREFVSPFDTFLLTEGFICGQEYSTGRLRCIKCESDITIYSGLYHFYLSSQTPSSAIRDVRVPFMLPHQLKSTVTVKSQSFTLITVVQRDPNATKQYTSNNKAAFKYRDHRGQLPASFSHSAVISRGRDNSLCSVLSCV